MLGQLCSMMQCTGAPDGSSILDKNDWLYRTPGNYILELMVGVCVTEGLDAASDQIYFHFAKRLPYRVWICVTLCPGWWILHGDITNMSTLVCRLREGIVFVCGMKDMFYLYQYQ